MHETQLARSILEAALKRADTAAARRVLFVRGRLAETEHLSRESLALSFEALSRGTIAEGARLELAIEHVGARCASCGAEYFPDHHVLLCPECGGSEAELLGKTGLVIETIEIDS